MKIAFIDSNDGIYAYASGLPRAVGGAERSQWVFSRVLAAAGWSVIVGVRDRLNAGERTFVDGVEFVGIGQRQILLAWHEFLWSHRPDWLYWRGASHLWGPAVEIAKFAGIRTIFAAACDLDIQPRHAPLYRPRWWPLYAWGLARTDGIFVQHAAQLSALPPRWRMKASILPTVCDVSEVVGDTTTTKPHAQREKYVAWVGMLCQLKRPEIVIEMARKAPSTRFIVCGGPTNFMSPPGYGENIVNEFRATPNIEYLGQVPPLKAQQVISDAAVLLCTSDVEGFPNTFVQAWSSGTPVVSLKIDPNRIIEQAGLGLVSINPERAIADIAALLDAPQLRDEIGIRARRFVIENYSAATVVTLFERALRDGR